MDPTNYLRETYRTILVWLSVAKLTQLFYYKHLLNSKTKLLLWHDVPQMTFWVDCTKFWVLLFQIDIFTMPTWRRVYDSSYTRSIVHPCLFIWSSVFFLSICIYVWLRVPVFLYVLGWLSWKIEVSPIHSCDEYEECLSYSSCFPWFA